MDELSDYDYDLPGELIAKQPLDQRDASRLLVLDRRTGEIQHRTIRDLPELLRPNDCLVLNDTQVIPARLLGTRTATGGKWEGLYLNSCDSGDWRLIGQTRGHLKPGEQIDIRPVHAKTSSRKLSITLVSREEQGVWIARPSVAGLLQPKDVSEPLYEKYARHAHVAMEDSASQRETLELLHEFGTVPLPPYIRRELATETDWERYQTSYARQPGAVAAPTAGLHFTPQLLDQCRQRGVATTHVTLHVGIGTFRPIAVDKLSDHQMHSEWCELTADSVAAITNAKKQDGRILAVGTTTVRTLESAAQTGELQPWRGETDIFIHPPYRFRAVDCLLTNFHLPRSTLLVLVSAFAGTQNIKRAYESAVRENYRFYSYGDAMLII